MIALLDAGSTVPFIARYRKEATGGLDDTQLRTLEERLVYLRELDERRGSILVAREAGLDALAEGLLANPALDPEEEAQKFIRPAFQAPDGDNPGVPDTKAALEGARHILTEKLAEDAELLGALGESCAPGH